MSPAIFFDLLFYTVSHTEQCSLSYMVSVLSSEFGIHIKKQSLHERFTEKSVVYVKLVLSEVLSEQFASLYSNALLPDFMRIRIKDSTKFKVPSSLSANYKSCGGGDASISIQYEYDLKSGKIIDLNITSGNRNDRTDAEETSADVASGDLMIRDLGYFSTKVLEKWMKEGAFFLSRLDCSTLVYDDAGNKVSFGHIFRSMKKNGMTEKEICVYIGEKRRVPVRLILQLVPEQVYEKRIREKTQKSKGQGRGQLKEETKIRCRLNLFITNVDETILPGKQIFPLYRLRWQIELHFKVWKSVFKINTLHQMKEHRYITLLYIKLILLMINLQIIYSVQQSLVQPKKEQIKVISLNKSLKTLKTRFHQIFAIFRGTVRKAKEIAEGLQKRLLQNHWLESKKKKLCLPEILTLLIGVSEK